MGETVDRLHETLAPGGSADHQTDVVILNPSGEDLGRRRGAAVDQDDHRFGNRRVAAVGGVGLGGILGASARDDDRRALRQELVGDVDGLIQQPAAVVAQVEEQPLHPLRLELGERFLHLARGRAREVADRDVPGLGRNHVGIAHRRLRDLGAGDSELQRLLETGAQDRDAHLGPFGSLEARDRFVDRQLVGGLVLDTLDDVAGADPQPGGGRAVDRCDDGQAAIAHSDENSQSVETRLLLFAHRRVGGRRQKAGVRIEGPQHAVDRGVDQVAEVDLSPVARARRLEQLGVEPEIAARVLPESEQPVPGQPADHGREEEQQDRSETPTSTHGGDPNMRKADVLPSAGRSLLDTAGARSR